MPLVHFSLGYLYWGLHQLDEAGREFHFEASLKNGEGAQALGYLGDIALQSGKPDEAESLFQESLQIDPGVRIAQYDLGAIYAGRKQSSEAVQHLETAIALDPKRPDAYYRLAMVYRELGQTARQRTLLTKVGELNSTERRSAGETISQSP